MAASGSSVHGAGRRSSWSSCSFSSFSSLTSWSRSFLLGVLFMSCVNGSLAFTRVLPPLVHTRHASCAARGRQSEVVMRLSSTDAIKRREVLRSIFVASSFVVSVVDAREESAAVREGSVASIDLTTPEGNAKAQVTDKAFFDISIGDEKNTSRIVIALYGNIVPKTVENFKGLVKGSPGYGYKGTEFYRIVQGLQISAGDVLKNNGRSGKPAINDGEPFEQENFKIMHTAPGIVSMQNTLEKTVDSRFFISTRREVDLGYSKIFDNKYVAFGKVIEGLDVVERIDALETKSGLFDKGVNSGKPKEKVVIQDCGLL